MFWKMNRKKEVEHATHIECPSCEAVSTIKDWNKLAKGTYGDIPDIRRAAINRKNSFPFQCPECFKGYSAHILTFHTNTSESKHYAATATETAN